MTLILIKKRPEPQALTQYRKANPTATYEDLRQQSVTTPTGIAPGTTEIKEWLLEDQGHLCAYCMRPVKSAEEARIEHYIPQSWSTTPDYHACGASSRCDLEYSNMLAVCNGYTDLTVKEGDVKIKEGLAREVCERVRGNDYLTVNPVDARTVNTIKYNFTTGEISSSDATIAADLSLTLKLNDPYIKDGRRAELEQIRDELDKRSKGSWSSLAKSYRKAIERMGSRPPYQRRAYAGTILCYLDYLINKGI